MMNREKIRRRKERKKKRKNLGFLIVISVNMISQLVSVLKLFVAQMAGVFFLRSPTIDPFVPSQTVVPLVSLSTIEANERPANGGNVRLGLVTLIDDFLQPRWSANTRLKWVEIRGILLLSNRANPSVQHQQRVVLFHLFDTCGKNVQWYRFHAMQRLIVISYNLISGLGSIECNLQCGSMFVRSMFNRCING